MAKSVFDWFRNNTKDLSTDTIFVEGIGTVKAHTKIFTGNISVRFFNSASKADAAGDLINTDQVHEVFRVYNLTGAKRKVAFYRTEYTVIDPA